MLLLGLTGFAQHGKDTTAGILAEYGFRRYAFADALRTMALAVNPTISLAQTPPSVRVAIASAGMRPMGSVRYADLITLVGYEQAKRIPDVRRFLQRLGTEGVRGVFGSDAWVRALRDRLDTELPRRAVLTDVRFPNEAHFITKRGGFLWRITRIGGPPGGTHPSEAHIPHMDADVDISAATLSELSIKVKTAYARAFAGHAR